MPDSSTLGLYRDALHRNPDLGESIVEIYHHGNGQLSIRYASGRLTHSIVGLMTSLVFHPYTLGTVEHRFITSTLDLPLNPHNDADLRVRMIYVITGVFLELGGGYHFRADCSHTAPTSSSVSPAHHHHKCSRCKKVRTCSGRYCVHMLKLHCDDCNEYFQLKRGTNVNTISLDAEASIPTNYHYTGADFVWSAALPEARPVESGSGGVSNRTYNISNDQHLGAATWSLDSIFSDYTLHNDALITGSTGGNEDGNL